MPTTAQEADKIILLCNKYGLQQQQLLLLTKDLHEQVGMSSNNGSVRETMRMLYERAIDMSRLAEPKASPKDLWSIELGQNVWMTLWYCVVVGHVCIWAALLLSCLLTIIYQPLHLTVPVTIFCLYLLTTNTMCPITYWENAVRRRLGWEEVGHFTHWYVICPLFHGRACNRKCSITRIGPG